MSRVRSNFVVGREQVGRAVPAVVMRPLVRDPGPEREDRRGPVQGLDLRLLIDTEDDGPLRRVQVQPEDVADLGFQFRVGGELERMSLPRLQAPAPPQPRDRREADPQMIRTRSGTSDKFRHAPEITAPTVSEPIGRGTVGRVAGVRQVASHRTFMRPLRRLCPATTRVRGAPPRSLRRKTASRRWTPAEISSASRPENDAT